MREHQVEELVIDIGLDGTVTVEGKNFADAECKKLSAQLEADLGEVMRVVEKPEMRQTKARTVARKAVR